MPIYRYPVMVWEDYTGRFTAVPVEDLDDYADAEEELAGFGGTEKEAVKQLSGLLSWLAKQNGTLPEPAVNNISCADFSVPVRPEYADDRRSVPCEYRMRIPYTCVYGNLTGDLCLASAPYIGLRFHYFKGDNLKSVFIHQIQGEFRGMDVTDLCLRLPPKSRRLTEVSIKVAAGYGKSMFDGDDLETLPKVAEPLDTRHRKRREGPAWEREPEITDLISRVRDGKANILVSGQSGAGKSTIIREAAKRISGMDKHRGPRFWMTSANRLIAGMKYLGQWEERCEEVIEELEEVNGILCVENLLDLVRMGGRTPIDSVAAFFVPYLRSGELRMIAEATPSEIDACRRLLPGLADRFRIITVDPMDRPKALSLFSRMGEQARISHKIEIDREVPGFVHRLFARYQPYATLPGNASRFLRRLIDRAVLGKKRQITKTDVASRFIRSTGLPEKLLDDTRPLDVNTIFSSLKADVIGQDGACRIAAEIIAAFKAGLNDPERPVGVLLFCGPTGVGKTQLAKTLTNYCFGHGQEKNRLIRLDMSEYAGFGAARRLTGDPAAGESKMIRTIRHRPFSVLLFDEIEKAAPEVFDVLLNILDEGRFTDIYGRATNFRSAIIVMTSNLGVESGSPIGFDGRSDGGYEKKVKAFFRPEFFNRIDEIVPFNQLTPEDIRKITAKELEDIAGREGLKKRGISLSWSEAAVRCLSEAGFHKKYGARNLQRAIEEKAAIPLARYLLENNGISDTNLILETDGKGNIRIVP